MHNFEREGTATDGKMRDEHRETARAILSYIDAALNLKPSGSGSDS